MRNLLAVSTCLLAATAAAQRGDRPGEAQVPLPEGLQVPAATPRSPAEQLATFRLAAGFSIAPFATDPMVQDPIAAVFDAQFRLWVVEMRGYMNDLEATGERAPVGRIVVLRDVDGDGKADTATTFLDGLVLPRAVLPLRGGALVVAPPELWWCPDADGDLVADGKSVVMGGFEAGLDNPEHSGNGLLWGFDHRIHLANDARMLRRLGDAFVVETGAGGGQWGLTHDDRGRLFFNYNEDWLRCDLVPGRHGPMAKSVGGVPQHNWRVVSERSVWPIRVTPGVNRGYQPGRLVDGVLAIHTAVCSPHVYRGGLLPCPGDVFVCEPAGNLVRRFVLHDLDGTLRGVNPYAAERGEFLASTDERFRPVHLLTGPDGALFVVDMYRGVIQHRNFVTTFLRRQIEQRGLDKPTGLGRIWRIVPDRAPPRVLERTPAAASVAELVPMLAHDNGLVRDLALQELAQRRDATVVPALVAMLRHERPAVRIAAFSALAALRAVDATAVRAGLRDPDPGVVAFALQHAGPELARGDRRVWQQVERALCSGPPAVRWHAVLALGDVGDAAARSADVVRLLALGLAGDADAPLRAVVATAAGTRIPAVLRQWRDGDTGDERRAAAIARDLAGRATRLRDAAVQEALFALAADGQDGFAAAVLAGMAEVLPKGEARSGWLSFAGVPPALAQLATRSDRRIAGPATELLAACALTGAAGTAAIAELTPDEQARVRTGERVFLRACAACHQPDGNGMQGLAPPLRDSEWVLGPIDRLGRIVLHGVKGPIEVAGSTWSLEMPGQSHLSDEELAAALSFVRRAFGHRQTAVAPGQLAELRRAHGTRAEPWTAEELRSGR
ncbi:MAG: HEAT repeat domain-containing protein [Planctomycetes bacterium]|nr:HEAT repeat domain-containing protein [Planctomycetota bacterium]